MNLKEAIKKINKDFETGNISKEKLDKILEEVESDHQLIKTLYRDLNNFERLKIASPTMIILSNLEYSYLIG